MGGRIDYLSGRMAGLSDVSEPSVALVNPPDPPEGRAVREGAGGMGTLAPPGGFAYPPHMLATAAASLEGAGIPFTLLDAVAEGWRAAEVLSRIPAGALAVVQVSHATRAADATFLREMRQARPDVCVLLVGAAVADASWLAEDLADATLLGEPELALPAVVRAVRDGARGGLTPAALGVSGYDERGRVTDLDALPFPAWDRVPWRFYQLLSVFGSRGCPDGCRYCPYVLGLGDRFRPRSVERVLAELQWLAERFAPPRVVFRDPVFAQDRERVLALCEGMRRVNMSLPWECESRPEHFDRALLEAMRAAGCTTVKIGVESADPDMLVSLGRVASVEEAEGYVQHALDVAQAAVDVGLTCRVFVMTGLPGETEAAVRRTARFLRRLPKAVRIHIKPFVWYPGLAIGPGPGVQDAHLAALRRAAASRGTSWWGRLRSWVR